VYVVSVLMTGIVVGMLAGLMTRAATGSSAFGTLLYDVFVAIAGAFTARWIVTRFDVAVPVPGQQGAIVVALIGGTGLTLLFRLLRPNSRMLW